MNKPVKKVGKLLWTFQPEQQRWLTHLARLRLSNKALMRRTGFSNNQINYALRRYKDSAGLSVSLRQRWANGTDPLIDDLLQDRALIEAMDAEIDKVVTPAITHPEMKTVRVKDTKAKTVLALARQIARSKKVSL